MSKLELKRRRAAARGSYAYRRCDSKHWDVVVDAEGPLGPRDLQLTKRQAIHLAYCIAFSAVPKIVMTYG